MLCFMLLIGIAITSRCYAADPKDVFREAFARQGFDEGSFIFHVKVDTYKGQEVNTAKIRIYFGGVEKQMITLLEPERLKDRLFLVIGYNTWMHQKGLKRPIRISGQQKLFGEAGIAETAGINYLDDYGIIQVREDEEEYLYELQALDPRTAYQRIQLWIGKNDLNLKEALLLAVNGKPLKRLRYYNHRFFRWSSGGNGRD